MDPERTRLDEDLRGLISGDVLCGEAARAAYALDGSLFEVWPLAVVRPRSADEVAATVAWAGERGIAVHARGAGTSICGGPLGEGIVIDCARAMRRIIEVDAAAGTVRVQPGVVAARLEKHLARFGRTFGPDPSNLSVTTIGGMIGRNASGSRFLRHGAVRGRLLAAQTVLADGEILEVVPTPAAQPGVTLSSGAGISPRLAPAGGRRLAQIAAGVSAVLDASAGVVARYQPPGRLSHGGYGLHDLRPHDAGPETPVDLPRLLCGAEGTLGIVTEATLKIVPLDGATAVGLLLFDSLEKASEASLRILAFGPSACDLFDKRHLALARGTRPDFDLLIPPVAEAGLLVEFTSDEPRECNARLDDAIASIRRSRQSCIDFRRAEDPIDTAFFWDLSRTAVSALAGVRAVVRPVPFVEDIVVSPTDVPGFLERVREVLRREQATAMIFGHVGHGQLHLRPYADPRERGERGRLERLAEAIYQEVVSFGGTIGGELGLGLSRTAFFGRLFPELSEVFAEVKRVFDPAEVLAPGRVVGQGPCMAEFRRPLRRPAAIGGPTVPEPPETGEAGEAGTPSPGSAEVSSPGVAPLPVLRWSPEQLVAEVDACNGCGGCRTQSGPERMCPRFRESPAEEASPRAKAAVVAALLAGSLEPRSLAGDELRSIADTCFNCHQCRIDCSAGVDIPALVMELKAANVAVNSLAFRRWLLTRVDALSAWGGSVRPLANWALGNPQARWMLEKTLGIARGRKLPPLSGNQFLRWASRRGLTRPSRRSGPRVLYFLDTYARRHDPLLGQALVTLLERHGIGVYVDPRQVAAGMPMVSEGDLDGARRLARTNLRVLTEAVRLGHRIICTEPAAVTCLTHDYPLLLDDDDMAKVAAATCDATTFLWEMHRDGRLRLDFKPVPFQVLYHAPCHLRAGPLPTPGEHLLRLVPGLSVQTADRGCSGMAGTFGLARENYRASLRVGLGLVSAMRGAVAAGATECSACRIQMEQGTTKPAVHPIKILARAYGLLPGPTPHGLDDLLTVSSGRLTTS
jgi:FAD/FMN-containing dehydrogenase/Fe-S oxidoreductase